MSALDRAFIKAYSRPWRTAAGEAPTRPMFDVNRPGPHFRIDPAHQFSSAPPQAESSPSEEGTTLQLPAVYEPSLPLAAELDPVLPTDTLDWVWQREPNPVFEATEPMLAMPNEPVLAPAVEPMPSMSPEARPLSAFSPTPQSEQRLRPQWEVDRFAWSAECESLCTTAQTALDAYVALLIMRANEGQKRVGIFGLTSGVGCTTVALCLARRAGIQRAYCSLVDVDFANPKLVSRLGVANSVGWESILAGNHQLPEVLIDSIEDHLALVPLSAATVEANMLASNANAPIMFDTLAENFDLVLLDAGAAEGMDAAAIAQAAALDAVYLVYDARSTSIETVTAHGDRLQAIGINVAGAIANFAPLQVVEEIP